MLPTKEELEAELERKKRQAREDKKHIDSTSRVIAPVILVTVVSYGAMGFSVLYAFSEWQKIANLSAIISLLVGIALVVLRINHKNGSPFSSYTIFNALLVTIFCVLYFLVEV